MLTISGGGQVAPDQRNAQPVPCNPALQRLGQARRVLLLQGPVGPFFDRLTWWLAANGAAVHRVVFHAGDARDCRACTPIRFEGGLEDWPAFLSELLVRHGIDAIVLFGQLRKHHSQAMRQTRESGIATIVLEEGYIRPGFVTMELGGVNGLSRTLDDYRLEPQACGLQDRGLHLVEGHTPTLVENADGVLINSTVGVQALARRKPLAVLGPAVYKRPGLFFDGDLDDFWSEAPPPDDEQVRQFLKDLIALTQVPCRVYGRVDEPLLRQVEARHLK